MYLSTEDALLIHFKDIEHIINSAVKLSEIAKNMVKKPQHFHTK